MRALLTLALAFGFISCASSLSSANPLEDQQQDMLITVERLDGMVLNPQVDYQTRQPDYYLKYVLSEDGTEIETRYMGPGETLGTPLFMGRHELNGWSYLMCAASKDFTVVLAKWRLDSSGEIAEASVRTEPFIEWRALGLKDHQLVSDVEWRPIVNGAGVGEWRR